MAKIYDMSAKRPQKEEGQKVIAISIIEKQFGWLWWKRVYSGTFYLHGVRWYRCANGHYASPLSWDEEVTDCRLQDHLFGLLCDSEEDAAVRWNSLIIANGYRTGHVPTICR